MNECPYERIDRIYEEEQKRTQQREILYAPMDQKMFVDLDAIAKKNLETAKFNYQINVDGIYPVSYKYINSKFTKAGLTVPVITRGRTSGFIKRLVSPETYDNNGYVIPDDVKHIDHKYIVKFDESNPVHVAAEENQPKHWVDDAPPQHWLVTKFLSFFK